MNANEVIKGAKKSMFYAILFLGVYLAGNIYGQNYSNRNLSRKMAFIHEVIYLSAWGALIALVLYVLIDIAFINNTKF